MRNLWEGLFKKNPVFVLVLGLVPAVAITSTAMNGWVLGLITAAIFVVGTVVNYALAPYVPGNARWAMQVVSLIVLIVVVYSALLALNPQLVARLGIFLPLIVVNSMVLQPCDREKPFSQAVLTAVGQGMGFILALVLIGAIREFLGFGAVFGRQLIEASLPPMALASSVPGGMIVVGLLMAVVNKLTGQGGELHD